MPVCVVLRQCVGGPNACGDGVSGNGYAVYPTADAPASCPGLVLQTASEYVSETSSAPWWYGLSAAQTLELSFFLWLHIFAVFALWKILKPVERLELENES